MIDPHGNGKRRNWHVVLCRPRQDATAEENLLNQGFETFRPKSRTHRLIAGRRRSVVESMFPRYLFVRLRQHGEDWGPIRSTRGTVGLVRLGQQTPIVPAAVIEALRQRSDDDGFINLSDAVEYKTNELVEIIDGPCAGYRAMFHAHNGTDRVLVLLTLLQHERTVELANSAIRKI